MGLFSPALTTKACKGPGPSTSTLPSTILVGGGGRPARHYPSPLARHPPKKKSQWLVWRPATTKDETRGGHETNYRWPHGRLHAFTCVLHTTGCTVFHCVGSTNDHQARQGRAAQGAGAATRTGTVVRHHRRHHPSSRRGGGLAVIVRQGHDSVAGAVICARMLNERPSRSTAE